MKNLTNGDSVDIKVINFIEANENVNVVEAKSGNLDLSLAEKLKTKKIPYIGIKVEESEKEIV